MEKIRKLFDKYEKSTIFIVGAILGAIVFLCFYGAWIIIPTHDSWTLGQEGDMTQHQIGWLFYRRTPWRFPIGLTEGLSSDGAVSCMYTDSIPLFAVVFKLFSPLLPEHFQYMGIWGICCYMMQGGMASLLLYTFRKNRIFSAVGSIFYSAFPAMLDRFYHHDALMAQWLILMGIYACAVQGQMKDRKLKPVAYWTVNSVLAVVIHPYYIPMVYMMMMGYIIIDVFRYKQKLRPALIFGSSTAFSLLFMWIIGGFYGKGDFTDSGLGVFSANLNSLVNPFGNSKFLKPMNTFNGQSEGLGYIGFGMIIMCIVAVLCLFAHLERNGSIIAGTKRIIGKYRVEIIAFSAVVIACFFLAASPVCTLNRRVLYTINYPDEIVKILSIFRCSGRFIWLVGELVFTGVMYVIARTESRKTSVFILVVLLTVQLLDMRDWVRAKKERLVAGCAHGDAFTDERWDEIFTSADEIVFTPLPRDFVTRRKIYFSFAEAALEYDLDLSSFSMARADYASLNDYADEQLEMLENGEPDEDTIYVFFSEEQAPPDDDVIDVYIMDGFAVAVAEK